MEINISSATDSHLLSSLLRNNPIDLVYEGATENTNPPSI